ncbi:conserved hypothetical protein [Parvibaculum lavamentivorans DS-1]|uniref:Uncharacterized protein n=1 Tax=Parvibaculum lavamentivorans (strain DS-1 / DSM 13023 / NCIMB 13966) TaxID=402881 RepID=A7HUU7_PARL1|nr:hypothetical protein [Parvibaculum lavamentivorans]ABS63680.1 conserved hypothetical protein [Parvibaculum lavamentivorans DS-1]
MTRSRRYTLTEIFAIPLVLAIFTIVGLVAALLGDGWRDAVSWLALLVPALTIVWALIWRRS